MKKSPKKELLEFYTKIENNNWNTKYSNNEIYVSAKAAKIIIISLNVKNKKKYNELILELDNEIENLSKHILKDADVLTVHCRNKISSILFQLSKMI